MLSFLNAGHAGHAGYLKKNGQAFSFVYLDNNVYTPKVAVVIHDCPGPKARSYSRRLYRLYHSLPSLSCLFSTQAPDG